MRLLLVPGVSPDRWARVWAQRVPDEPLDVVRAAPAGAAAAVLAGDVDAAVLRLPPDPAPGLSSPGPSSPDLPPPGLPSPVPSTRDGWAVVPLWEDRAVVVVPREHLFTVVDAVDLDDLRAEPLLVPADDVLGAEAAVGAAEVTQVPDTPTALDLVASGAGVVVLPHALAREHGDTRFAVRDVPEVPASRVALVWHRDAEHPLVQELVGIVRGRTAGSSRGDVAAPPAPAAPAVAGRGTSPRTPRTGTRGARPARGRGRRAR
ncbi:LysR family transcriptional regulator [Cellulomonas sp. JZ18]|uniref:LysR family transcriptional regulator substrate-binding protein n=1 Tax=Cellulomonas sp. JZ18 TaxID=2654191 RepID=UPI0012D446ED|nr:LysR family transcriptional regulator substrate-binding protein [Cellulomonas sp. JZ18]QGQ20439.1 LysR family transcriptional regulator [Cellulomonas sp. JZ18]